MTLGDLVHTHGLLLIGLLWIAYVLLVAVQGSREQATHRAATSAPVTFEEVVTERPRINQAQAVAILDAARARKSGGSE